MLGTLGWTQAAAPAAPCADLNTIIAGIEQAQVENRAHFRPYIVTRDYKLYKEDVQRPTSEVVADVSFQPPDQKQYQIKRSSGSGSGEKIVRKVLDRETEITRDAGDVELSRKNYDFDLLRTEQLEGSPVYVLQLRPKREDKSLIKGVAYIDTNNYRIRRIVGHPAKNPSWLVKDLQLTLTFTEVKGMWLQTASQAVANVRFVGKHIFTSQDVSVRTAEQVAQKSAPLRPAARRLRPANTPASAIGSGVFLPR
ncbi:MAG TPA: hypothetical protein VL382_09515 [Terriglobales bacterium]|nr:hypothetical protein [Terriglobales bacterium]